MYLVNLEEQLPRRLFECRNLELETDTNGSFPPRSTGFLIPGADGNIMQDERFETSLFYIGDSIVIC